MTVECVTYLYVAHDAEISAATLQEHTTDTDEFLEEHLRGLRRFANAGDVPDAAFRDDRARELFTMLRQGNESEFLDAATELAKRLISEMDGRTTPGLLVFVRYRNAEGTPVAAALKMQVVSAYAGVLQDIVGGKQALQAVRNVLDAPGKIQKGIAVPDDRPSSEMVVGDKLGQGSAADYFVKAFGVVIDSHAIEATLSLLKAVNKAVPDVVSNVIATLPTVPEGPLEIVLDQLSSAVPELESARPAIEETLRQERRPIKNIATGAGLKRRVAAGPVTITGPASLLDPNLTIVENPDTGGWTITIETQDRPVSTLRK